MHYATMILVMFALLLLKGFFSGSELALVNADKLKLTHKANHGHRGAGLVLRLLRTPELLLTTTLVGTNLATITLSTLGTLMMIQLCGAQYSDLIAFVVYLYNPGIVLQPWMVGIRGWLDWVPRGKTGYRILVGLFVVFVGPGLMVLVSYPGKIRELWRSTRDLRKKAGAGAPDS